MKSVRHDFTKGGITKQLLLFALPLVATNLLQALYNMADTVIVGRFAGSAAISAVSNSGQVLNLLMQIAVGISTGGNIVIGQLFGSGQRGRVEKAAGTLFSLTLLMGAAGAAGVFVFARPILRLLDAPAPEQSFLYLRICAPGILFVFGYNALAAVLRGVGDSRTPLMIIISSTLLNAVLDLVLVAGLHLGVAGAAWATLAAQTASFVLALVFAVCRTRVFRLRTETFSPDGALLRLILRLGIPGALQMTIVGLSWLTITYLVNGYGVDVSAASGAVTRLRNLCQLTIFGMATAASTMIAQNLGAQLFDRAWQVVKTARRMTIGFAVFIILSAELFAPQLARIFTDEPAVIAAIVLNLRIEILGQFFQAILEVYQALANGAGHTEFSMFSSFMLCIVFRVTLSLVFGGLWGAAGIYIACAIAPSISVLLGFLYARSGMWRRSLAAQE